jgi:lysophospholipase L1-like esterase
VLCVGDSNTFGLDVDPEDTYPAQLERIWNERVDRPPIEVVNLGAPGMNSSAVAARLPGLLETWAPDTLLVMVGVNDFWAREATGAPGAPGGDTTVPRTDLRVVRLFSVLRARLAAPTDAEQYAAGVGPGGSGYGGARRMPANLAAILATARSRGVTPVLLTYPSRASLYAFASQRARAAGRRTGVRVVDLARVFERRCPDEPCDLLRDDGHPTAAGYRLVAETLAAERVIRNRRDRR